MHFDEPKGNIKLIILYKQKIQNKKMLWKKN